MKYDYLVIGAGLSGAVFSNIVASRGKTVLVVDRKPSVGGACETYTEEGITVHKYGPHIFHTNNCHVWNYVRQFGEFKNFINSPIAIFNEEAYNLPFNMNTFSRVFGVTTPEDARRKIEEDKSRVHIESPMNLEEQAMKMVGPTIYNMFIKEYTEKQWGKPCTELSPDIIKRLPLRFTYNNNYFNDSYQGIPIDGYSSIISKMLDNKNITLKLNYDYIGINDELNSIATKIIYTGRIDEFFNYKYGKLEYRGLDFSTVTCRINNFYGNAVVNYTSADVPYTRITEHKYFLNEASNKTIISYEYPCDATNVPEKSYYPIETKSNIDLYNKYRDEARSNHNLVITGRLGLYKYYNMDKIVELAIDLAMSELKGDKE